MKIALIQFNPKIGDLKNNTQSILNKIAQAKVHEPDLIVFPELSLIGYPPKDLLFNSSLLIQSWDLLNSEIIPQIQIPTLLGIISPTEHKNKFYNSMALIENKQLKQIFHKKLLPDYEVFNESRYFKAGALEKPEDLICEINKQKVAVLICEDLLAENIYTESNPIEFLEKHQLKPDLIICSAASPYRAGQPEKRLQIGLSIQAKLKAPLAIVNQVGAQDDLIFDGSSFLLVNNQINALAKGFEETILICETTSGRIHQIKDLKQNIYEIKTALVLGIRDYFKKTGFTKAFIGLSGGIDSALVAVLAAEALKPENVYGILMPSKYSSAGSIQDSKILADNLKIQSQQIAIEKILENFLGSAGLSELTLAEENLQARIRGSLLMALANENKALVLATGNKSEFAVGYSTLYGDMCGALAPIGDLWKTQVWELAKICPEIPQSIIDKPPSAELRPNQLDCDSLPDYALLDQILKGLIEKGLSVKQLQNQGLPLAEIEKVFKLFSSAEFKRRQAPIILKVSKNAFGSGWLYPVAAKF